LENWELLIVRKLPQQHLSVASFIRKNFSPFFIHPQQLAANLYPK
jgi:hypothetical protein